MDDCTGVYDKSIPLLQILEQNQVDLSWIAWSPDLCKELFYDTFWDIETY